MDHPIRATLIKSLLQDPFMVWCEFFAPQEKEGFSAFTQSLMAKGVAFERKYDATLGPLAVVESKDMAEGFAQAKALMKEGAPIIINAPLVDAGNRLEGRADVLMKKTTHKSVFGKWHYLVHEVKSGRELKEEYVLQAAFYHLVLGRLQGYTPQYFFVVTQNGDGSPEQHRLDFNGCEHRLKHVIKEIQAIADGSVVPPPNIKACGEPWSGYCLKRAQELDDISLVANAGTDKQEFLRKAGIGTVQDLLDVDGPVPGLAQSKLQQLKQCATALKTGKSFLIQDVRLPASDVEYFIDFEGIELDGKKHEYLLGVLVREKGKESFHPFLARTPKEQGKMLKDALTLLDKHPDAPVYHYATYEKTAIKNLGDTYRIDVKPLIKRLVDILQVCRRCVAPASSTFSLKDFGRALGASWRGGVDAAESMVLFQKFQQGDEAALRTVIDYNEDDVRALLLVKDWLVEENGKRPSMPHR